MPNTFTQIYIQIVFAVEWRQNLIQPDHKEEIHKYITGIVRNKGQKLIEINTMPDHLHMLIGLRPDIALSDLVREVKKSSTLFHKRKQLRKGKVQLAGRLWRVLIFAFSPGQGDWLYSQSGKTSWQDFVQEGIHDVAAQV